MQRFDLNEYDIQRVLRENVNLLETKNRNVLNFVRNNSGVPADVRLGFLEQVKNSAAEMKYLLAISDNKISLQTFVDNSPLFRQGRS